MQANTQGRQIAGAGYGVTGGIARHHQTGGGQDAVAMGALDGFVDRDGGTEVIRRDDQALQRIRRRAACGP
jgi:hypothetical protein